MIINKAERAKKIIRKDGVGEFFRRATRSGKFRAKKKLKKLCEKREITSFLYYNYARNPFEEGHPNVDHSRKLIYVHIPKTGGTSIKNYIDLSPQKIIHSKPHEIVHRLTWNKYFTFTSIRNPVDRFLSNYFFHTSDKYSGGLNRKLDNLKDLSVKKYFEKTTKLNLGLIKPQHVYIGHKYSNKLVDFVCRIESISEDIKVLCEKAEIEGGKLPHKNSSGRNRDIEVDNDTIEKIVKYYNKDFNIFGYDKNKAEIKSKFDCV